jgi:hypothetical protein
VSLKAFKLAHGEVTQAESHHGGIGDAEDGLHLEGARKRKGGDEGKPRKRGKRLEMDDWTSSAKIDKLCEILESIRSKDPFEKVIVFSQVSRLDGLTDEVHRLP